MTSEPPILLITRTLPEEIEDLLQARFDPRLNGDDAPYEPDEIADFAFGADGIVVVSSDDLGAEVIDDLDDSVRIICCTEPTVDRIDLAAAKRRGIVVTNAPDATDALSGGRQAIETLSAFFDGQTPPHRVA